jgi:hypothetical protein
VATPGASGGSLDDLVEQARADAGFEAVLLADLQGHILAAARDDETTPETLDSLLDLATRMPSVLKTAPGWPTRARSPFSTGKAGRWSVAGSPPDSRRRCTCW